MNYFLDFYEKKFKMRNIMLLLYIIFNAFFSIGIFDFMINNIFVSIISYIICIFLALTVVGDFYLRFTNGMSRLNDVEKERLLPLFEEVYEKALKKTPNLRKDIELFICRKQMGINAFALGRRTICLTKGALRLEDEDIKAFLGHEFGHLANKDTDVLVIILVGNMIFNIYILIIKFILFMVMLFSGKRSGVITYLITMLTLNLIIFITSKLIAWILNYSGREEEYQADKYSGEIGYRNELIEALDKINDGEVSTGIFNVLEASHPDTCKRIEKLKTY